MNAERWDRKHSFPPAGDHYNAHWLQVSIPPRPLEQRGRKYQNDLFTGALGSLQWRLLVLKHESRFYFTSMLPIICPFCPSFQVAWKHDSRNVPGPCHLGRWWGGCSGAEWMRLTGWYSTVQYSTVQCTVQYSTACSGAEWMRLILLAGPSSLPWWPWVLMMASSTRVSMKEILLQ